MSLEDEEDEAQDFVLEEEVDRMFMSARDGDHVMSLPFECDLCQFRNVAKRDVDWKSKQDIYQLVCIRAASLDAMWSRERHTVEGNVRRMRLDLKNALPELSIAELFPKMGNPQMEDKVGMGMAIITLHSSLRRGRHASHLQWDSMRRTPTWYSHVHEAVVGSDEGSIFASDHKKMYATQSLTRSRWFTAFLLGAKKRMGVIRKQDEALTIKQLLTLLEIANEEWKAAEGQPEERKRLEEIASFVCIGFCASLRGEEVPLVSIRGINEFWDESLEHSLPHIMITLRGRFKGEDNTRWHMIPIARHTRSNIPVVEWVGRLMHTRLIVEEASGPLFADKKGKRARLSRYNDEFRRLLERTRERDPSLFTAKIMIEDFSLRRSLRRGSTTEAQNNNVPVATIELINRWRKVEHAKGTVAGLEMRQVYTQARNAIITTARYSQSL